MMIKQVHFMKTYVQYDDKTGTLYEDLCAVW